MNNNYVRITNDKGQEVVCDNFSQLFECLTGVNEKYYLKTFKVKYARMIGSSTIFL